MLRALASYFFGGIEDETSVECETREVNDWLVVNLPDQNKDNINLNVDDSDDDIYGIDDEEIRKELNDEEIRKELNDEEIRSESDVEEIRKELNDEEIRSESDVEEIRKESDVDEIGKESDDDDDTVEVDAFDVEEMDSDEDDVLLSLSVLMMPQDTEQLSSELSNEQFIFEKIIIEKPLCICPFNSPFCKRNSEKMVFYMNNMDRIRKPSFAASLLDLIRYVRSHETERDDIAKEVEKRQKFQAHVLEVRVPPLHSKNYIHHRHPEKLLNYDVLQRIYDLEPQQQAVQRSARKNLARGQFNRQNKNYMYETSSKKNRRCNRQRNHSGANNNRKC